MIALEIRTTEEDGILMWSGPKGQIRTGKTLIETDLTNKLSNQPSSTWAVLEMVNGRLNWIWKPIGKTNI